MAYLEKDKKRKAESRAAERSTMSQSDVEEHKLQERIRLTKYRERDLNLNNVVQVHKLMILLFCSSFKELYLTSIEANEMHLSISNAMLYTLLLGNRYASRNIIVNAARKLK